MARRVADLRLALGVMSREGGEDPWWSPSSGDGRKATRPLRVALVTRPAGHSVAPLVSEGVYRAGNILEKAGYDVEEVDPPMMDRATPVIESIADTEIYRFLPGMLPQMSKDARTFLNLLMAETKPDLDAYMDAISERYRIASRWQEFMRRFPLILGPVSTRQPFGIGEDIAGREEVKDFVKSITLTETCNLLGLPSVALPVQVAGGLPQGIQLISMRDCEHLCLDAAESIEHRAGTFTPVDPLPAPADQIS